MFLNFIMKILVIGAGSIGIFLGTMLAKDHEVTMLGHNKLKQLHDTIIINDSIYSISKRIYKFPKDENYDVIFITSKLFNLQENLKEIVSNNLSYDYLVSIQNGLVDKTIYESFVKKDSFTTISIFEGYRLIENQLSVSSSKTGWITENSKSGNVICDLLVGVGINCNVVKSIESIKANKMVMNCAVNILCALERKTFFELFLDKRTKKLMDDLFDETYSVLEKEANLDDKKVLKARFYETIQQMKHYSSTYQDAIKSKRTEIDFLNKYIIDLAKKLSIPVPENKKIVAKFEQEFNRFN